MQHRLDVSVAVIICINSFVSAVPVVHIFSGQAVLMKIVFDAENGIFYGKRINIIIDSMLVNEEKQQRRRDKLSPTDGAGV